MADETRAGGIPEEVASWLDRRAEECEVSRAEFLRGLAAALDEEADHADAERVAELEDELDEKIADVRERVLQVKAEAESKAPAEHGHVEIERQLAEVESSFDDVETSVASLRDRLADTEDRLDDGFENFEDVLDYLTETTDDLERKTQTLATALLDVREGVQHLASQQEGAVDELAREANRIGVRSADCEECGGTNDVALLREPHCPHCGATFVGVERKSGFFGSHTLLVGEHPPALEAGPEPDILDEESDVAAIASDGGGRDDQ